MSAFIQEVFSQPNLIAFFSCNIAAYVIFMVAYGFTQKFYPRATFSKHLISVFIGFFLVGLFLYPTPAAFKTIALLNLIMLLLLTLFLYGIFTAFPVTSNKEKIGMRVYTLAVLVIGFLFMMKFAHLTFLEDPKLLQTQIIPSFGALFSMISFFFLLPIVGTIWLIRDARRRRQKTKELWAKAQSLKK